MPKKKSTPQNPEPRPGIPPNQQVVFSYHASRSRADHRLGRNMPAAATARQRRLPNNWQRYWPSIISVMVIAFCFMYASTLTTDPKLSTVTDQPITILKDVSVYEHQAQAILERSLFNRSKLTIDTNKLANELVATYPEIAQASVTVPLVSRRPIIEVQPSTPALILSGQNGAFVVDVKGRALLGVDDVVSAIKDKLPIVRDETDIPIETGKQILPTDLVAFIGSLYAQLEAKDMAVQSLTLPVSANELHLRLRGDAFVGKFNTEDDARLQFGTYVAVRDRLEAENKLPKEYIDVRVEERAYYR